MITAERVRHSGAIVLTALVTNGLETFYETRRYYGHTVRDAKAHFRQNIARSGFRIVRD